MARSPLLPVVLAIWSSLALCVSIGAQTPPGDGSMEGTKVRVVPPPVLPIPFSTENPNRAPALSIEFRAAHQMTERDRLLAADAESSIAEHAGLNGFALEQGKWNYQQVVCPALPNHLFLQYARNNGVGDVTVFSASIPRGGEGRVRIIPILRRGYSLFSPAPINALTISAFNHIRAEEAQARSSNWLGNGLCYAALAGGHPRIDISEDEAAARKPIAALTATLDVPIKGGEVITFADSAAIPKPMEWTMTFTSKGKLMKATHFPAPLTSSRPVPENSAVLKTWTVPQTAQR